MVYICFEKYIMSILSKKDCDDFMIQFDNEFLSQYPDYDLPSKRYLKYSICTRSLHNTLQLKNVGEYDSVEPIQLFRIQSVLSTKPYVIWQNLHEIKTDLLDLLERDVYSSENQSVNPIQNSKITDTHKIEKPTENIQIITESTPKSLSDLLKIIEQNPLEPNATYNIDLKTLHYVKPELIELNSFIGLSSLKTAIVEQILYYFQRFDDVSDYKHTVISGSPGTGKTEIARILGRMYSKMGIFKTSKKDQPIFKKVTRTDLVAGYLGQTAIKTNRAIQDSLGGVLFIDEAYSLGCNRNSGNANDTEGENTSDSYSKECADTLCEALSNHKDDLMVIIAGYEKELTKHFFTLNRGLESRFNWRFIIDNYCPRELYLILLKKIEDAGWKLSIEEKECIQFFEKHKEYFKFNGRDVEVLFFKMKIAHSKRVFGKALSTLKELDMGDLENGYQIYIQNKRKTDDDNETKKSIQNAIQFMYC